MTGTAPAEAPTAPLPPPAPLGRKLLWVSVFYFSSGLPFGLINYTLPIYLRLGGATLDTITKVTSDAGAAWTFKFLWAPLVDRFGTRKAWIVPCQVALGAATLGLAVIDPAHAAGYLFALLVGLAALSATQDVAVDAYTIELLDRRQYGVANGTRVTAYRIAMLFASSVLVWLSPRLGWPGVFTVTAAVFALLALITLTIPVAARTTERRSLGEPLADLLRRPRLWAVILFALAFKLGDVAMQPVTGPFAVDRGLTPDELGLYGALSIGGTIVGAIIGGTLTTRWGAFRGLWLLGLLQALSNLGYAAAASAGAPKSWVYGAGIVEQLTGGMGTAAFLAFLMSLCDRRYAATQYAFLSALFGASRWIAGRYSGGLAQSLGYQRFFLLTFLLAFPAYLLLPVIRPLASPELSEEQRKGLE